MRPVAFWILAEPILRGYIADSSRAESVTVERTLVLDFVP